jgi:soluble lytic murein transglycosylase
VKVVAFIALAGICLFTIKGHGAGADGQLDRSRRDGAGNSRLTPTEHSPLPTHPSHFWLVPERSTARGTSAVSDTPLARFARGVKLYNDNDYAGALPLVSSPALATTTLADYARYYTALAQIGLERVDDAAATLESLATRKPSGYLSQAVALKRAELATTRKDPQKALDVLEALSREKTTAPESVLLQMGRAAQEAGDRDTAMATYLKLYFDFPLSADADLAKIELDLLEKNVEMSAARFSQELGRSERLFSAKRYDQARDSFARLSGEESATGDNKELIALRIAECDYYLRRYRASRDALRPFLDGAKREAEARFFHLTATRALGDLDIYVTLARGLVNDFPKESWTEETLNNLASHYIIQNEDAEADLVFRELYEKFPQSRHAERAAWKIGWWAYKNGDQAEALKVFEAAAAAMPRADTRPAWLYWSARANETLGHRDAAIARYRLVATDYLNSYYGRLASKALDAQKEPAVSPTVEASSGTTPTAVPNDGVIRQLIALELYEDAVRELQYAQRVTGDSPAIQATYGYIYNRQGDLRRGINAMKRAYPQYLAAGGEELPADLLGVLFPLDYWPLIKKYSASHQLDPYIISALIAQESTFDHDVRSSANAYGLMQVIPGTGRRYARSLGMRRFSTATLTDAESNVRIGTAYFKDLVDRFGGAHFALASYNAGEHRIARWISERPGISQEEFIDDIPYPETQNYVKKILGTAEDYRRLYGGGLLVPGQAPGVRPQPGPSAKKPTAVSSSSKAGSSKTKAKPKVQSSKPKARPKARSPKPKAGN